ncbi:hypothetical protein Trydic_g18923 [Trypoxylus dichotomus]
MITFCGPLWCEGDEMADLDAKPSRGVYPDGWCGDNGWFLLRSKGVGRMRTFQELAKPVILLVTCYETQQRRLRFFGGGGDSSCPCCDDARKVEDIKISRVEMLNFSNKTVLKTDTLEKGWNKSGGAIFKGFILVFRNGSV